MFAQYGVNVAQVSFFFPSKQKANRLKPLNADMLEGPGDEG
jgi:hypothetical protein